MYLKRSYLHHAAAFGFVAALAGIGLASHPGIKSDHTSADVFRGAVQSKYEAAFVANNPLEETAVSILGAVRYGVFGQAMPGAIVGRDGWLFTTEELVTPEGQTQNIALAAGEVAAVHAELAARGITLIPVILPNKAEIYSEALGVVRPEKVKSRRQRFLQELAAEDIAALDATDTLLRTKETADAFMRSDTHWSPDGSRAVAHLVAEWVRDQGIPLAPATVTTRAEGRIAFDGDLLRFIPTGAFRPLMGPPQEHITRYTTTVETGGGLFGAVQVDAVLVGTSFSAREDWHFAGFLKQALSADVINFSQEGRGPFRPMDAFLASDFLKNTPPKTVIWEIPVRYVSKELRS
ncbi:hypothetical protein [uncultured Roseobacter sp.]|uniref:alginate O-acetyltransferase AlgX-related protein n=1 Tax=uncultured Roseobacter sp. TaxID=114847 RepID=UPI002623C35C|nr:hypothetical protein [uncultured Roseobacter sp.]